MFHATCTQGNWGDSRLLVVKSQIVNLTSGPSFGYNLCVKCPNGSWKPILDIYVSRSFQWYKELLNPMAFDPCNYSLKISDSTRTPIPKVGAPLGVWGFIPSHSLTFLGTWNVIPGLSLGPHLRKLKARVMTHRLQLGGSFHHWVTQKGWSTFHYIPMNPKPHP
jgi:hypothetical protein